MATYTVKSGDNLSKIASANGVSLAALEAANPQLSSNYNLIQIGSSVNLPSTNSSSTTTTPTTTTPTTTTPAKTTSTTTTPSTSSNNSTPQVEFTTQYGNVYQGATVSNANGRITWTNPDGSTVWLSSDTNTYPNNAQYIQQYAPQYYTAPASSTSSTSSSSNSNAGLSPDVATLGLQMANIGSQAALAAGYSATDVPQYDSNGKIIPKSQAPAPVTTTPATTTPPASTQPQTGSDNTQQQAGDAAAQALEQQLLAAGMSSTGNASLDAIQLAMATQLQNMINSGQMINPNIALSPSDVQAFLTQATNNLAPDMQNQIQQILTPLQNSISALQNQYETDQQTDLQNFQQNLAQQENTNAGYGLSQSSVRDFANLNLVNSANTQLGSQYNSYVNQAANLYNTAQNSVGGAALPATQGFSPYAITSANRGSLVQEGTNNTYFQPSQSIAGSIEAANQVAIQQQAESAAGAMLQQRALPFYTASSTT